MRLRTGVSSVVAGLGWFAGSVGGLAQGGVVHTAEEGDIRVPDAAHALAWWTEDPLRLDATGDLFLGQRFTRADYKVGERVRTVGVMAGRRIVQVRVTIHAGPQVVAAAMADEGRPGEWKTLLVQQGRGDLYRAVYQLQDDNGGELRMPMTPARVVGRGAEAMLVTFDPGAGMGGGCWEGYWWVNRRGSHAVDFGPLDWAIAKVLPKGSTYTSTCWARDPEQRELKSVVQAGNASCQACGMLLGTVTARYRLRRGKVEAVSVRFVPEAGKQ